MTFSILPWQLKAGAATIALSLAFGAGWKLESLRWTAANAKVQQAQISLLKKNIKVMADVLKVDTDAALADAKTNEELERISREIVAKAPDSVCLLPDVVDRLRDLWK